MSNLSFKFLNEILSFKTTSLKYSLEEWEVKIQAHVIINMKRGSKKKEKI